MRTLKIQEPVLRMGNTLGECPLWHPIDQCLCWTDIDEQLIFRYVPESKQLSSFPMPKKVGSFAYTTDNRFILAVEDGFAFWDGVSEKIEMIQKLMRGKSSCMMNDGSVDFFGHFFAGSKSKTRNAKLYRIDSDLEVRTVLDQVGISNGIDWWEDYCFHVDSFPAKRITRYHFRPRWGELSDGEFFYMPPEGVPDGLTIDSAGHIWVAIWDGGKIIELSQEKEVLTEILLPVSRPTSVCFGGNDLKTLYITSASVDLDKNQKAAQPYAGDLFAIDLETSGRPVNFFPVHN